ncbi:CHASE2 domain-containing protein [Altericista sp. CCNU0014]|uniref:CHASE2 domain-containing protein n=1 Tax=Altericista sp. CCNU0014 TaxID=3082949 RepID=UPI00384D0B35
MGRIEKLLQMMRKSDRKRRERDSTLVVAVMASLAVTLLVLGLRGLGRLEWLELVSYDWMMRLRPEQEADARILVVGITEKDLQSRGSLLQLPDSVYAGLLAKLRQAKPRAIGIDIYRDTPIEPGHDAFVRELKQSDRIIGITKLGDATQPTIQPPKALPIDQIGFNDVLVDRDGILRRAILFQPGDDGEPLPSFSLLLAWRYLQDQNIESKPSERDPHDMQLGQTVFPRLQANDGGYVRGDAQSYLTLLNYRGGTRAIPMVSLGAMMAGQVPPEQIRDRIILIGNVAESGRDFFNTPLSAGQVEGRMPGVIVHAQMVSLYLDAAFGKRPLFWFWPEIAEGFWVLGWSALGGILAVRSRSPLFLGTVVPVSLAGLVGFCFAIFLHHGWIPVLPPVLGFVMALGSGIAYSAQQAQRQQQMIMRLLGQSTSPEIADTLWQRRDELLQNGKLPGQQLTATLLFTDLKGFSAIAERYAPEQVLNWLNEYLDTMAQLVQKHQGIINKFTGDGIMAVFGVPIPHEQTYEIQQDARNAVDCAIAMDRALAALNVGWQTQGLPEVKMRVGIFTGPVVVGSLGSPIRLEYGVIGDGVNIASRLESFDKDRQPSTCRILIAQQTRDCLTEDYQLESWGAIPLKGKAVQVQAYRVLGRVLRIDKGK